MKGRENRGPPATDLLVCFPTRAHLSLLPKPICSPARPSDSSTLHHLHHRHRRRRPSHHQLRKHTTSHGSPYWAKNRHNNRSSEDISEPTSPKVTCAGQIKVRSKPSSCKNWQSVMEEIERLHNQRKHKKKSTWIEALGFKKDVMQFLTCLRNIRFDFRCFGAVPSSVITSDDDEEDDEEEDYEDGSVYRDNSRVSKDEDDEQSSSRAVFSKWFTLLQEDLHHNNNVISRKEEQSSKEYDCEEELAIVDDDDDDEEAEPPPPPPNALLLMRCRSAPVAKSWMEEEEEEEQRREREGNKIDLSEFSGEISREIGEIGGIPDMISRSRSWRR